MDKLKLYVVNIDYVKYLQRYERQVLFGESEHYIKERKYLGVVLKIGEYEYFAPLSSPKESDYFYKQGQKEIRKSTMTIIRLISEKGILLGKIKLNNMIPVPKNCLTLYDFDNEPDKKYKDLITDELICIRKSKKSILKNAQVLYKQKINNYEGINYLNSTIDFKNVEKYCSLYEKN